MENKEIINVAKNLVDKFGTQKKAAEALGVTELWFNLIINGRRTPSKSLFKLMQVMGR